MIRTLLVGLYRAKRQVCKQQSFYASNFIQDENSKMKYWENTIIRNNEGKYFLYFLMFISTRTRDLILYAYDFRE